MPVRHAWIWTMVALVATGCSGTAEQDAAPAATPGVVDIVAQGLTYEAPDETPSGWTTFRFHNESAMTHFAVVERLPEGIGIAEHQKIVAPIFQQGMDLLNAGDTDAAMAKFGTLPEWFPQIVFTGGPGLTAPGHTSQATIRLEPGRYLLECYVKTGGIFHSYNPDTTAYGMVHAFTVTDEVSPVTEPEADVALTLSGERGIEGAGDLAPGTHTVSVTFEDQKAHENFLGHDVHLVRIAEGADMDALATWMDWSGKTGLQTPAPAEFLGGLEEMPAGSIGYFTVTLEPGRYAWISEVTKPQTKGMLREFTVSDEAQASVVH